MSKKNEYRPNVAMIIVSNNYPEKKEVFIAQRNDILDIWQFPQGGIDKGEDIRDALFREMKRRLALMMPRLSRSIQSGFPMIFLKR